VKTNLCNITITLEESVARWAKMEAARQDTSVGRLLASMLKERMQEETLYKKSMRRALARKLFLKTDGRYLSREEVHERSWLR
jgi:tRNA uridine 5-carbamoylmethylation protein Kti12